MVRWVTMSLLILVGVAGCSAVSPDLQSKPVPVKLVNNATQTETFTVASVKYGSSVTVHDSQGVTFRIKIDAGVFTYKPGDYHELVKVEFPRSAQIDGNYTLNPGQQRIISVENYSTGDAIVVAVYDEEDESYRAIQYGGCSGWTGLTGVRVTTESGGPEDWTTVTRGCG